mmetsp:Transcript_103559/g.144255  ORF Transcript_103559/g.144255 Transcript_103559/m.144255 type:complete len:269 (-) Transcript_103559:233-1039(-)
MGSVPVFTPQPGSAQLRRPQRRPCVVGLESRCSELCKMPGTSEQRPTDTESGSCSHLLGLGALRSLRRGSRGVGADATSAPAEAMLFVGVFPSSRSTRSARLAKALATVPSSLLSRSFTAFKFSISSILTQSVVMASATVAISPFSTSVSETRSCSTFERISFRSVSCRLILCCSGCSMAATATLSMDPTCSPAALRLIMPCRVADSSFCLAWSDAMPCSTTDMRASSGRRAIPARSSSCIASRPDCCFDMAVTAAATWPFSACSACS